MIRKLLIANRGEIACRVMRTAKAMGIATVAVYSDADAKALHVRMAGEAVHIGPSPAAESYLVGERIIAAATETGADAIHPGYGFLSENADFARAVIDAGITWVGPAPESIEAMGLKDAAKKVMQEAGVPVTPGYLGEDQSPERLKKEADSIGYPVLIKAVAGGGGKGMRKVDAPEDFLAALESCKREAKSSFANDEVLLEKWITSPRHIEVQVFGDTHGNVVHLFERDCSLQRRHQKVIEEAPAPGMDEATREAICGAAVRAAKAVDYVGAGTIEFIADASEGLKADRIFFMEMNTRLQVEHPVTEEITGVDLVEWQLRVASGEPLPLRQDELSIDGWAIEARLYAEDPAKGFLPSTGRLDYMLLPKTGIASVATGGEPRVDTGVEERDLISPFYDPMIAKIICWGKNRNEALDLLANACEAVEIEPVRTNAWFLARLCDEEDVREGSMTTAFIGDNLERLIGAPKADDALLQYAADDFATELLPDGLNDLAHEFQQLRFGFRLNAPQQRTVRLEVDGETAETSVGSHALAYDSLRRSVIDGPTRIYFEKGFAHRIRLSRPEGSGHHSAHDGDILAPMPGKVIAVDVAEGDAVEVGQRLLVLEAMKMEHALTAPFAGTVAELSVSEGSQVQVEALLARVKAPK
ncbi:acetyl/propionyl/methylcrotonyl-CoA carboxylase subunit alpha [Croceibacterium aestuarii]|uniref:acetyl/propionyl/methylcrotonyl-CoA carboxylase subunit alpha n=1 Tax=Croceibacterium aestuarii TaxID=3064139 RepID=UPI00272E1652|nr:acetyl/propionyl/methylcrotonyl-CoA carboxylase subunit alpha [Croceibacterium sp. D39]